MFYRYEVLNKVNLKHIQDFYNFSDFDDGARTGSKNKDLKNNVEMQLEHTNAAWRIIWDVWQVHTIPKERLFASQSTVALFVKYTEGMHYNWHSDAPYMSKNDPGKMRSDFSTTLFLNDPDEYEGGELVLRQGTELREIKLPAGWAFSYPTGTEHMVKKITSGERKVAVWWTTSVLRNMEDRQLAVYNCQAKESLLKNHPKADDLNDENYPTYRALEEQINSLMRFKGY
jgi:PKHD-type hydroxylase